MLYTILREPIFGTYELTLTVALLRASREPLGRFGLVEEVHWSAVPTVSTDILEKVAKMQFEVFTYMNNNVRGMKQSTQRSGAPTKSLTDRLKGKDGRIRGNLMGN